MLKLRVRVRVRVRALTLTLTLTCSPFALVPGQSVKPAGRQSSLERNRECVKQCSAQHMAARIQSLHCELSSKQSQPARQRQSVTYLPHTGQSPQVASLGSCR